MKFRLLIIESSPNPTEAIKAVFSRSDLIDRVHTASNGTEGLNIIRTEAVDLVVCNIGLPDMDGLRLIKFIREIPGCDHLPILFLPKDDQVQYREKAFELGAQEFMMWPLKDEELIIRAKSLVRIKKVCDDLHLRIRDLEKTANVDPLTGLFNRKYLLNALNVEFSRSRRHRSAVGCLMMDLDNFKSANDRYGHPSGDRILQELAQRLNRQLRGYDFAARYGGDEFIILLPQSSIGGAMTLAKRLRNCIGNEPFLRQEGKNIPLTVSIGVAMCESSDFGSEDRIISMADRALYQAKRHGRNTIAIAESPDHIIINPPKGLYRRNYRKYQRLPFLSPVRLVELETEEATEAFPINISYGGMAMYVPKDIPEKSGIDVGFSFPLHTEENVEETVKGTVRWTRRSSTLWITGIKFEALEGNDHPMILSFIQEAERLSG